MENSLIKFVKLHFARYCRASARPFVVLRCFPSSSWGCTAALAGARLRMSRAYLAGGDDHAAADAGDAAAGFDFGDAARMAAEFAPILGGAPAGAPAGHERGHWAM